MIAHSRPMFRSFVIQLAVAFGVFYELGCGLASLPPAAAVGLAVLPLIALMVAPAFLMGSGERAHDGKYLLRRFIVVQLVAVGLAAVAFGSLAWLQVPASFLLLAGVAYLKRVDLSSKGSGLPVMRMDVALPLCLVAMMVLCCLAVLHGPDWDAAEFGFLLTAVLILVSLLPALLAADEPNGGAKPVPEGSARSGTAQPCGRRAGKVPRSLWNQWRNARLGSPLRFVPGLIGIAAGYSIYVFVLVANVVSLEGIMLFPHEETLALELASLGILGQPGTLIPGVVACLVLFPASFALVALVLTIRAQGANG